MLEHRRCPHCGYDLRMLPTDPDDGSTVCPECGCAWGLDEPTAGGDCASD
jgi:transcription initiation factor TFIIIB Brf1 subunit/transcription initiation factor TFIIB